MKSKALYLIYIFPILFLLSLAACDDMDDYSSDPKHTLWFSQDTLRMDTVLTGIPTSTRQLKVYNPHKKALLISSIILADAGKSGFRINVDGIRGDQFSDIEIAGEDSLYIFVEATLPQQDNADIRLIKDSILFQLNGIRQEVKLRAYAQDAFTFRGKVIEKDTLIASQRPILIYDSISVRRHPFYRSYGVILPNSLTMLLPSALGFSPHPPVSVYGTGTIRTIAAFLDAWLTYFPTRFRSASRLRIALRFFLQDSYLACTRLSTPRLCSPHVSPQFCLTAVQESQPVVHRLRLSPSP